MKRTPIQEVVYPPGTPWLPISNHNLSHPRPLSKCLLLLSRVSHTPGLFSPTFLVHLEFLYKAGSVGVSTIYLYMFHSFSQCLLSTFSVPGMVPRTQQWKARSFFSQLRVPWENRQIIIHEFWCEVKWKSLSHVWLFATPWTPGQNTGLGSLSLLQQIFLTQESNWGLLHCRWILYQLSYHGSPQNGEHVIL